MHAHAPGSVSEATALSLHLLSPAPCHLRAARARSAALEGRLLEMTHLRLPLSGHFLRINSPKQSGWAQGTLRREKAEREGKEAGRKVTRGY